MSHASGGGGCEENSLLKLEVADGWDMGGIGDGWAGGVGLRDLRVIRLGGGESVIDLDRCKRRCDWIGRFLLDSCLLSSCRQEEKGASTQESEPSAGTAGW